AVAAAAEGDERPHFPSGFGAPNGAQPAVWEPPGKIVQRSDAGHNGRQRRRNLGIAGIGPVLLALDEVLVDFGAQRLAHQTRRAGKLDDGAARRHALDLETLGREPVGYGLDVRIGRPEPLSKLAGCKPLVIIWRGLGLL